MPPIWVRCGRKESCLYLCNWINVLNCVCMGSSTSVCMYVCVHVPTVIFLIFYATKVSRAYWHFALHLQSKCFFFGPMHSSVVALHTDLASPWPARLWRAANSLSLIVCPAIVMMKLFFFFFLSFNYTFIICKYNLIWLCAPRNGPKTHTHAHWN